MYNKTRIIHKKHTQNNGSNNKQCIDNNESTALEQTVATKPKHAK